MVLLKETSLVSVIALPDLMFWTGRANVVTKEPFLFFGAACLIYMLLLGRLRLGHLRLEDRTNRGFVSGAGRRPMNWCQYPGYVIGNEALTNYGCRIFGGLGTTLQLVAISIVLGSALGLGIALVRLYGGPVAVRDGHRLHHLLPRHAAAGAALPVLLRRRAVPPRSSTLSGCGAISARRSSARRSPSR